MLGRLHLAPFLLICLLSSLSGAAIAFLVSQRTTNSFGDLILFLILVPLGLVCPSMILVGIRREQKQSLEHYRADERRDIKLLPPENLDAAEENTVPPQPEGPPVSQGIDGMPVLTSLMIGAGLVMAGAFLTFVALELLFGAR